MTTQTEMFSISSLKNPASNPLEIAGKKVDGRSVLARRYRDYCVDLLSDLATDAPSTAQVSLIRRAATLEMMAQTFEDRFAANGDTDTEKYFALIGRQCTVLERLGLQRRAKDVTPKPVNAWADMVRGGADA